MAIKAQSSLQSGDKSAAVGKPNPTKKTQDIRVVLHGKVLDLSKWANRHPGGRKVLFMFDNRDATEQFVAYHSPEAIRLMQTMSKGAPTVEEFYKDPATRPVLVSESPVAKEFEELRQKFVQLGYFKVNVLDEIMKLLMVFVPIIAGFYLMYNYGRQSFLFNFLGAVLHAFGCQQAGWTGHDYSHHSVYKSVWWNHFYANLCGFVQGYSLYWWKARHNTHHVVTNEVHNDPDIKTSPLLTFFASQEHRLNWLQRFQSYYYVPVVSILDLYWKFESLEYVLSRLSSQMLGVGLLAIYWIATYFLFAPLGFGTFMMCCLIKGMFTGLVVFATHYSEERLEADPKLSFAEQSARTSRNISGGLLMDYFSGCISRQISHHMFPMMPTSNLPKADKHVRSFLAKHGIDFNESSLLECTVRCMHALKISDLAEVS